MTPARDNKGRFIKRTVVRPERMFQGAAIVVVRPPPPPWTLARVARCVLAWFSPNMTGPRGRWCPP